jgi:hypothetical protein
MYRFILRTISRRVLPSAMRRAAYTFVAVWSRIRTIATRVERRIGLSIAAPVQAHPDGLPA